MIIILINERAVKYRNQARASRAATLPGRAADPALAPLRGAGFQRAADADEFALPAHGHVAGPRFVMVSTMRTSLVPAWNSTSIATS